jgi:hypothetical protein
MVTVEQMQARRAEIASTFPASFGLRGFPGRTFRIAVRSSYWKASDSLAESNFVLYTEALNPDGTWTDWAKGSPAEIRREMCAAPLAQAYSGKEG